MKSEFYHNYLKKLSKLNKAKHLESFINIPNIEKLNVVIINKSPVVKALKVDIFNEVLCYIEELKFIIISESSEVLG